MLPPDVERPARRLVKGAVRLLCSRMKRSNRLPCRTETLEVDGIAHARCLRLRQGSAVRAELHHDLPMAVIVCLLRFVPSEPFHFSHSIHLISAILMLAPPHRLRSRCRP
jgi:hypothetical protein